MKHVYLTTILMGLFLLGQRGLCTEFEVSWNLKKVIYNKEDVFKNHFEVKVVALPVDQLPHLTDIDVREAISSDAPEGTFRLSDGEWCILAIGRFVGDEYEGLYPWRTLDAKRVIAASSKEKPVNLVAELHSTVVRLNFENLANILEKEVGREVFDSRVYYIRIQSIMNGREFLVQEGRASRYPHVDGPAMVAFCWPTGKRAIEVQIGSIKNSGGAKKIELKTSVEFDFSSRESRQEIKFIESDIDSILEQFPKRR